MAHSNEDWEAAAREVGKGGPYENIRFRDLKQFKEVNPAEAVFLLRNMLRDFGVRDECIIASCEEARRRDSVEWALFEQLETLGAPSDYSGTIAGIFNRALSWCKGFSTDWKFSDNYVEYCLNIDSVLGKYGLRISFSPHEAFQPFEISLSYKDSGTLIDKVTFQYSYGKYLDRRKNEPGLRFNGHGEHDMHELIDAVNKTLEKRGLELLDADEGGDSYAFVLFDKQELGQLEETYGDVRELVNLNRVLQYLRSIPKEPDPTADMDIATLTKKVEEFAARLRREGKLK